MKTPQTEAQALQHLAAWCSASEHCPYDVLQKARAMGLDPDAIDRILLYLLTEDYVNVRRYVRSYIHDKHNLQHWGRKRIRHELSRRLLPQAEINAGLAEIDDVTYRADLLRLLRRRYKQAKGDTPQALYRKLQNHALGLGYEPTLINQCLKQLLIAYTPPDTEDD